MTELKEATKPRAENGPSLTKGIAPRHRPPRVCRCAREPPRLHAPVRPRNGPHVRGVWTGRRIPRARLLSRGREMLSAQGGVHPGDWSPRIDVVERDGNIVVRADLPGLGKDDIKIEITDDLLTIQGEHKRENQGGA